MTTTAAAVGRRVRTGNIAAVRSTPDPADPRLPVVPDDQHLTASGGQVPQPLPHRDHRPRFTRAASTAARPTAPDRPGPAAPGMPAGPVGLNRIECRGAHSGHRNVAPHTGHHRCFNRNVKKPSMNPAAMPTMVNVSSLPTVVSRKIDRTRITCPPSELARSRCRLRRHGDGSNRLTVRAHQPSVHSCAMMRKCGC